MVSLRHLLSVSSVAIAALAFVAFAAPTRAKADTFNVINLHSDQGYFFYGMDDIGDVVLRDSGGCGASDCYYSFLNGAFTGKTSTAPSIVMDNGTTCTPSVPAGGSVEHGICNNGRDAFTGFLSSSQLFPGVYTGASFQTIFGPHGGEGFIFMNSLGDIVFEDDFSEAWYEAIPATTPEPSALLLLATGAVGLTAFAMRRRQTAIA